MHYRATMTAVAAAFAMALCAGAAAGADTQPLPPGAQKIPPERLAHYWLLIPESAQANAPNSGYGLDAPTCVAVSYAIEKNGTTSHVKLEHAVPPGPLAKVAARIVTGMRFAAAAQNAAKEPVLTYVVIPFNLPDPQSARPADRSERQRVLDACKMADFLAAPK